MVEWLSSLFEVDGDHRELQVMTHSFPTRRSADLRDHRPQARLRPDADPAALLPGAVAVGAGDLPVRGALHGGDARRPASRRRRGAGGQGEGAALCRDVPPPDRPDGPAARSEEYTSELQSLMRTSYAVFCLKQNTYEKTH